MASQIKSAASNRSKAPRRTMTIGVRLTPDEIAGVDAFIAAHEEPGGSRAGAIAWLALEKLSELQAETRPTAKPRP